MWGNILIETNYHVNFNTQFPNTKTDVLIHLAQWQYWWWFWFSFLWVMYYLFLARTLRYRTLKFRPKIVSSFRPHGKWGDLIICLIPVSWCANILINSNFLLKLLEWQAESSLFTIRIRGKQWYWVYKFDFKNFTEILSTPKNIGNNKWVFSFFGELKNSDNFLHLLNIRAQNKVIKKYWIRNLNKFDQEDRTNLSLITELLNVNNNSNTTFKNTNNTLFLNNFNNDPVFDLLFNKTSVINQLGIKKPESIDMTEWSVSVKLPNQSQLDDMLLQNRSFISLDNTPVDITLPKTNINKPGFNTKFLFENVKYKPSLNLNNVILNFSKNKINLNEEFKSFLNYTPDLKMNGELNFLKFITHEESNKDVKLSLGKPNPISLIKIPVSKYNDYTNLFKFRYNDLNSNLNQRNVSKVPYFAFKQVRYKRRKLIPTVTKQYTDIDFLNKTTKGNFYLKNQYSIETDLKTPTTHYRMFRKNRFRNEKLNVVVSKRLLRVKKTLVLPTHVNIAAITNSYDVVHSWFIPGLGLKMDCVPGRSTHHTLYIDNSGFYYGQCAEICGRYHHHMPIRVCALPFEHFLIWWHTFGLPKLMYPGKDYKMLKSYSFRKFVW